MALGSSAPEILLAVIETASTLGGCPGELGPSTIVGSAAFNLLVISGLSILAVTEENDVEDPRHKKEEGKVRGVKKINDMGVFTISSIASIVAYLWLWFVLMDQNVEIWEAWVTFAAFAVLVILCYGADRYKAS
jgi:solute carrier family 8 (sodium/calcium exchanger)